MTGRMLRVLMMGCFVALATAFPALAESLTIGGTGSSSPIVRILFEAFRHDHPDVSLNLIAPPLGSGGGLKALAEGRIDLAIVARPLKPAETALFGQTFDWVTTPYALASPNGKREAGFTLEDLAKVYLGSLQQWDSGAPIRLVLRTLDDSETQTLAAMSPEMDMAIRNAVQRPGMVIAMDDLEAIDIIARTPNALGGTSLGLIRSIGAPLSAFPINGVMPSVTALKEGRYPWRKTLSLVLPKQPGNTVQQFADFLRSDTVAPLLARYDYLPVGQ
jgi:phosphate transport system substrate-binding protein